MEDIKAGQLSEGERRLASAPMLPLFARFAVPGVMALLFFGVQILINGALIGNFAGAKALASMNLVLPIFGLTVSLCIVLNVGCQCLVGLRLGAGDSKSANEAFFTAYMLTLAATLGWAAFSIAFAREISSFMGADKTLVADCAKFLRLSAISMPMTALMFFANGALRAQGRPLYSLCVMLAMVFAHLVFDILFIAHLKMGLEGAAYATILASAAGFMLSTPPFFKKAATLSFFKGGFSLRSAALMLYNGSSEGMAELSMNLSAIIFNRVLMATVGGEGVAAFTAVHYIAFVATVFFIGLTDGARAIISFNYGMKNSKRVLGALKLCAATVAVVSVLFFVAAHFFGGEILDLFFSDRDAGVINLAQGGAKIFAFAFLIQGFNILFSAYFTAIGNAKVSLVISFLKGFLFVIAALFVLKSFFGVDGIWAAAPVGELAGIFVAAALMAGALRSLRRGEFKKYV